MRHAVTAARAAGRGRAPARVTACIAAIAVAGAAVPAATRAEEPAEVPTVAEEPVVEEYFARAVRAADAAELAALGARVLEAHAADPWVLDSFAWRILTDESLGQRDLPLALRAARLAHDATGGADREVAETLARALVLGGEREAGIAMQRRAIELSADDPQTRLVLEEILAEYLAPPADPGPDDAALLRTLEREALALVAAGRAVSVRDLLDRAAVAPCRVETAAPRVAPCRPEDLHDLVKPSVVVLATVADDGAMAEPAVSLGTGFVIHESGIVVTNFHVIDPPEAQVVVALTAAGAVHPVAAVLAVSPRSDIAICRLDGAAGLRPLPLVPGARPGARLHALSHPDGALWSFTEGILSRHFVLRENGQAKRLFATTADVAVGSSGGPLVDDRGNVVGMVTSTLAVYSGAETGGARDPAAEAEPRDEAPAEAAVGETAAADADPAGAAAVPPAIAPPPDPAADGRGDFQMGFNICVPADDILALVGGKP